MLVGLQERFLQRILGVLAILGNMQSQPEYFPLVPAQQGLKSDDIAFISLLQPGPVRRPERPARAGRAAESD